ncbi:hypothetical protein ACFRFU_53200 [Streptomyces sp. NPDC056704]|uniref:effector-associated constant component EACC1 n=1 Tax=Streptomyces sp. NPDC056704 TaxID=3345917 RepID=UPI00368A2672
MSKLTFEFQGTAGEVDTDARDLAQWIQETEDLNVEVETLVAQPGPGELGGYAEAVEVVVGLAPYGSALITIIGTYLLERVRRGPVRGRVRMADGSSLSISAASAADVDHVERSLRNYLLPKEGS